MSPSKQQLSDYQVCHVIGSGSFGTCYKVRHKNTNKIYVWKVIDYGEMSEEKKKLLVSEVNVLSELNSKYIVKYHDRIIVSDITTLYIIMEYCPGGDLASLIKKCKRTEQFLEEKFIWKVLYQLSVALQVCHSSCPHYQILHRDIKPANVFLDEENNVKLGDFGLARVLSQDESHSNTLVGTPYYMSPEVIKGGRYNLKSDIWALGCLIYELCSFKPPFHGDNIQELSQQILDEGFDRIPSHYSEDLHHTVHYMLSKNNEIRPSIESLLQHPLVAKNTSSWIQSAEFTKPSVNACREWTERQDDKATVTNTQNRGHYQIAPANSCALINPDLNNDISGNDKTTQRGNHSDPYDEIYGTCIDESIIIGENVMNSNSENYIQPKIIESQGKNYHQTNKPFEIENETTSEGTIDPVQTKIHICYKSQSKTNILKTKDSNIQENRETRKPDELGQNQLSFIRQIFNSKMHMNTIKECYSSDENIYMNNKSLLSKNHINSDKNNNASENFPRLMEEIINEIEDSKLEKYKSIGRSYLETAIDEVREECKSKEETLTDAETFELKTNIIDTKHDVPLSVDAKNDQIVARCQTLEDKINEMLAIQNINQRIKSNHLHDLEVLLQEKLDRIRQHEAYIKNKEKQLQTLELNLNKREKNVALQEKMVQEKIQRAQVYLKQCKDSRKNLALRAPIDLELKSLKENFKMFNTDLAIAQKMDRNIVAQEIEQETNQMIPTRSKTNFHSKTSKTNLPVKKSKDILEVRRNSTRDNDSSFSADPGDTSILPTMCKLDPDKVKPMKYYKHVHFNDEFIELFNDIGDMCQNKNKVKIIETNDSKSTGEMCQNKHRWHRPDGNNNGNVPVECAETRNALLGSAKTKIQLKSVRPEANHQNILTRHSDINITTRQADVLRMKRPSTNTNLQINNIDDRLNLINSRPSTSSVKLNPQTSIALKTKQMCLANHQKHSLSDFKLLQEKEERRPLSNIFANNNIPKQISRSSGLVGPGFITRTLNSKTNTRDDHGKSVRNKTSSMLPTGNGKVESGVIQKMKDQENGLTGVKKHFVKSKTTLSSNCNVQQWMNKSRRYREIANINLHLKPLQGQIEEDKENRMVEDRAQEIHDRPSGAIYVNESGMKQLNSQNLDIVRKQLQPLTLRNWNDSGSLQNHQMRSNIKDILHTRYADLELSPFPSELFDTVHN